MASKLIKSKTTEKGTIEANKIHRDVTKTYQARSRHTQKVSAHHGHCERSSPSRIQQTVTRLDQQKCPLYRRTRLAVNSSRMLSASAWFVCQGDTQGSKIGPRSRISGEKDSRYLGYR